MQRRGARGLATLVLSLILAANPGCKQHSERAAIDGVVRFKDGRPIDRGSIGFSPADEETSATAGAAIIDGRYHISREKGLSIGRYVVRIYASALTTPHREAPGQLNMATPQELISSAFNTQSTLVATVRSANDQRFDFEVE